MDLSPFMHALAAVTVQCAVGLMFGMWGIGGVMGCLWFIAREHTQAEYRWISRSGNGRRESMPWWGGFDWRAWNMASLLDWLIPVFACTVVFLIAGYLNWTG